MLGAAGVAVLSPDALMVRLFDGDNFALAAGRGLALAVFAGILTAALPTLRRGFRWRPIAIYGAIYAAGLVSFPMSIRHTHVANTVVILAIAPLLSAVGARWFLGEKIAAATWIACAAAAVGIGIVFAPQLAAGGGLGNWLALLTALSLAGCAIVIRANPTVSFAPGLTVAGFLCFAAYAPFANWQLPTADITLLIGNGALVLVAFLMIMAASHRLPPPEINLLFLLESVLAPLWVWLALSEKPPAATVLGGVFILVVLALHSAAALRSPKMQT